MKSAPPAQNMKTIARWIAIACLTVVAAVLERSGYGGRHTDSGSRPRTAQSLPPGGTVEGQPRLVDGDSFFLNGTEVRMVGIDAPEGRQTCERQGRSWPCGEEARKHLAGLLPWVNGL